MDEVERECSCCGCKTKVDPYESKAEKGVTNHFCDLCAETLIGAGCTHNAHSIDKLSRSVPFMMNKLMDLVKSQNEQLQSLQFRVQSLESLVCSLARGNEPLV